MIRFIFPTNQKIPASISKKTTGGSFQALPDKTKREGTMAEKDITEKILMSYADVFADCINTLVYGGRQRLKAENTEPAPTESFYGGTEAP